MYLFVLFLVKYFHIFVLNVRLSRFINKAFMALLIVKKWTFCSAIKSWTSLFVNSFTLLKVSVYIAKNIFWKTRLIPRVYLYFNNITHVYFDWILINMYSCHPKMIKTAYLLNSLLPSTMARFFAVLWHKLPYLIVFIRPSKARFKITDTGFPFGPILKIRFI